MASSTRKLSTDELTNGIIRTKDLKRYMGTHAESLEEISLCDFLNALLERKQLKRSDVILRANLDRSFGYQIFDGSKSPSRDKLLQLAIGFGLDYQETCALLRVARKPALYARLKREAVIIYCISHHMSIMETQYMLTEAGLSVLGMEKDR